MLYLHWKMGQVPGGGALDSMDEAQAERLVDLITFWENQARAEDFRMLGLILGGDPDDRKS